jgi:hypothetical protein
MLDIARYAPLAHGDLCERRGPRAPRHICASVRSDLLLEIKEAVLAMTERIESLLQFTLSLTKNRSLPLEDLKKRVGRTGFEFCGHGSANCS